MSIEVSIYLSVCLSVYMYVCVVLCWLSELFTIIWFVRSYV